MNLEQDIKIIEWFGKHYEELDNVEFMAYAMELVKFIEKIKPIYEKHNSTTFIVDLKGDK